MVYHLKAPDAVPRDELDSGDARAAERDEQREARNDHRR
jgi:hypothetical protein